MREISSDRPESSDSICTAHSELVRKTHQFRQVVVHFAKRGPITAAPPGRTFAVGCEACVGLDPGLENLYAASQVDGGFVQILCLGDAAGVTLLIRAFDGYLKQTPADDALSLAVLEALDKLSFRFEIAFRARNDGNESSPENLPFVRRSFGIGGAELL